MGKSWKWVGLAAALVCAGSAMAAGKTEAASSNIGSGIDTAVDLSASPTLQRWQAGGTVVLGVREAAVPMSYAIGANEKFVGYHMDLCERVEPDWWALENPVGRLARAVPELGKWRYTWNPSDYGDPYTKRTCMWGDHVQPMKTPVEPTEGSRLWRIPPGEQRKTLRSITPPGFARAFFEANP